jgi:hypothetical protein
MTEWRAFSVFRCFFQSVYTEGLLIGCRASIVFAHAKYKTMGSRCNYYFRKLTPLLGESVPVLAEALSAWLHNI